MEFHNRWAKSIDLGSLLIRENFESPSAFENHYALEELGPLAGKSILDLGCGAGESSVYFALQGADVYAYDIAEEMLKVADALAHKYNVKLKFAHGNAAHLPYEDDCFDFVYGNGVLHHVDLLPVMKEVRRVLKKGGKAIFVEPLAYNPLIAVYRHIAKEVRTKDESPLRFKDMKQLETNFSQFHHREFWLFSLFIFVHFFLIKRWHPSNVRYWKKVIEEGYNYERYIRILRRLDETLLKVFPFLKFLCWDTVLVAVK